MLAQDPAGLAAVLLLHPAAEQLIKLRPGDAPGALVTRRRPLRQEHPHPIGALGKSLLPTLIQRQEIAPLFPLVQGLHHQPQHAGDFIPQDPLLDRFVLAALKAVRELKVGHPGQKRPAALTGGRHRVGAEYQHCLVAHLEPVAVFALGLKLVAAGEHFHHRQILQILCR